MSTLKARAAAQTQGQAGEAMKRASTVGRRRALTDDQVRQILAWYETVKARKTVRQLAEEIGVAPATIYNVITRRGEYKQACPTKTREAKEQPD